MHSPISAVLILLVTVAVFSVAFFFLSSNLKYSGIPVSMNIPAGQVVYRDGNTYYIPVQVSMADNAPPVRICLVNIRYMDGVGNLRSENVDMRYARDGVPQTFIGGSITFQKLTITKPHSQTIIVRLNPIGTGGSWRLVSLYVQYCLLNEDRPLYGEELRIPGEHLTP